MPFRRSARAPSTQPSQTQTNGTKSAIIRSQSVDSTKRPPSPERTPSPPPKRSRTTFSKPRENGTSEEPPAARKLVSRTATFKAAPLAAKRPRTRHSPVSEKEKKIGQISHSKPYFNPLPIPPEHKRPGLQLFAWGAGNFGQFGMGPDVLGELDKPKKNPWVEQKMREGIFGGEGAGLESAVAGGLHTLLIDEKGTIWTCGVNDDAALGRVTQNVPNPEKPGSFMDVDELTSIPHPLQSLTDEQFRAVQVTSGDSICAALSDQGDVRVWGSFRVNEGSLGFSSQLKHQFHPVPILDFKGKDAEKTSAISAGSNHILVLTTHGNIFTWGAGEQAQLGRKVLERRKIHGTIPEKVTLGSRSRKAIKIGAGSYHSFAVDDKGDVWAWGLNSMGQTGTGYRSRDDEVVQLPKKVKRLSKEELSDDSVVQIEGGNHHSLFLTASGRVYACGRSNAGQLGLPDDHDAFQDRDDPDFVAEPVLVPFPDPGDPVIQISCGPHNNMAVTTAGALYCWGQGIQGELGVLEAEVKTPLMIVRKEGGSWSALSVSCGGQHTLGLFRKKEAP